MTYESQRGLVIAKVIARPSASILLHKFPLHCPDIPGRFNKRSQSDRPLRKNSAIDKSWRSWPPACKRINATLQRNGWREVRSRARSIGGKDNLRYSDMLDLRQSG